MNNAMVYLCGPIDGRTDDECNNWRSSVKRIIGADRCLDPMRRDGRKRKGEAGAAAEIVEADKLDIMRADVVLVYYYQPSVGTSMEILFAWEQGKRVRLVNASGIPDHDLSFWLQYHCHIFSDLQSALRGL